MSQNGSTPRATPASAESTPDINELFARAVSAHPDVMAVQTSSRQLSYRDLDQISASIAARLDRLLAEDGRPIALWLEEPADIVCAILGVLRGGRIYSVVSHRNPAARLKAQLHDLQPAAVLVPEHLMAEAQGLGPAGTAVLSVDALSHGGADGSRRSADPLGLASIYYTSGSTGEPKGVLRTRALIAERGRRELERYGLRFGDRLVMCYALSATASLSSMFAALFGGASLYIYEAEKQGITALTDIVADPITAVLRIPVELLRSWLDSLPARAFFPSLRVVGSAGDILYRTDVLRLQPHVNPGLMIATQYAMSELGPMTTNYFRISELPTDEIVPVGWPYPRREILIVDEDGQLAGPEAVGEICIRSAEKFHGYWNRPDLNLDLTIADPADPARPLYRTGDLGKIKPDGQLVLAGRKDQRVKIRGFNVNMSAIEAVLMQLASVRRAVVVARPNPAGERRVVAYVLRAAGAAVEARQLQSALAEVLPDFMLPASIVFIDEVPLTRTGKVDRQALPPPRWDQPERAVPHVAPRDDIEERLAAIWKKHLRIETVGIDDEFFSLGGDSLLAVSLMASIEKEFARPLLVTTMIKAPTIRQQADILRSAALEDADPVLIPVRTTGKREPVFCLGGKGGTPIRFRALLSKIDPDRPVYYFRSRGLRKGERTIDHVEEIAAQYLIDIKRIQPQGPYFFLGESGGGIVAYEMAQQLIRQGARLGFLGMLDTYLPRYRNVRPPMGTLVRKHLQNITGGGPQGLRVYIGYYLGLAAYKLRRAWSRLRLRWLSNVRTGAMARHARVELANIRASRAYSPQPYPHSVHLFHAVRQARYEGNVRANGWADVGIGDLVVHPLDCYHGNVLFEPFVSEVARTMNQLLR